MSGSTAMGRRLGIDLGGTKTAVSVVDDNHEVVAEGIVPTFQEGDRGVTGWAVRVAAEAGRLLGSDRVTAVGAGVAGPISSDGRLLEAPNLPWPAGSALREALVQAFGRPVAVLNDANAALLGEVAAGVARGQTSALLVAVGTGIGGGLLFEGRLVAGARGVAGEIGHVPVPGESRPCGCGGIGHLETVAAGRGLAGVAAEAVASARPGQAVELRRRLADGEGTRGLFAAAEAGDPVAQAIVEAGAHYLGVALAGIVTVLDPALVILTGGLAHAGFEYAARAQAAFRDAAFAPVANTPWVVSTLGEKAGTIGAAFAGLQMSTSA